MPHSAFPAGCQPVGGLRVLPKDEAVRLANLAHAFSDPIRIAMIHLLQQHDDLCTCELERLLELSQSKVSYHLRVLLDANVVTRKTAGTWSLYSLALPDPLALLRLLNSKR